MKTTLRLKFPLLDNSKFSAAFDIAVQVQVRQAARAWLRVVREAVPVWTGEARGSLIPLGQYLRIAIPITPVAHRPNHSPSTGASKGGFKFAKTKTLYKFRFITDVRHYQDNEFVDWRPIIHLTHEPIPWHTFEAGLRAFNKYLDENLNKRLPKIKKFITTQIINVN